MNAARVGCERSESGLRAGGDSAAGGGGTLGQENKAVMNRAHIFATSSCT